MADLLDIPFNRALFLGEERRYMEEALRQIHISADGAFTQRCQQTLERVLGVERVMLTTSCTDALEMSALLLDLEPGDEVVMPTFTFVSTANAYALRGARPVFVDSRPDTLNLDERQLEAAITPRTRAIVVVHYAGVACAMDEILAIAGRHGIPVIEDNAHGLFGRYKGRPLGSLGAMATLSFHETKNVSCGEGGALCLKESRWVERAEILRTKGTNRARFLRGEVDKYTWVDVGSSFGPSDLLAAILCAQLDLWSEIQRRRRHLWERYRSELAPLVKSYPLELPTVPADCEPAWHMFQLLFPGERDRNEFLAFAKARKVLAVFHYIPLHACERGLAYGYRVGQLPVAESASARLARLPFYNTMSDAEQTQVIETVRAFVATRT